MKPAVVTLLGLAGIAAAAARTPDPAYRAQIETWRAEREARLKSDGGWLQVVGLFWLKDGANTFGTDAGNRIVLPAGSAPARAGVFELRGGKTTVRMDPGVEATVDGKPAGTRELRPDVPGPADVLKLGPRLTLRCLAVIPDHRTRRLLRVDPFPQLVQRYRFAIQQYRARCQHADLQHRRRHNIHTICVVK